MAFEKPASILQSNTDLLIIKYRRLLLANQISILNQEFKLNSAPSFFRKTSPTEFIEFSGDELQTVNKTWQRRLVPVVFLLKNCEIVSGFSIQRADIDYDREFSERPENLIKSNVKSSTAIQAGIDYDKFKGFIYLINKIEGQELYKINEKDCVFLVRISSEKLFNADKNGGQFGVSVGVCSSSINADNEVRSSLTLTMPEHEFSKILERLNNSKNVEINIRIALDCFVSSTNSLAIEYEGYPAYLIEDYCKSFLLECQLSSKIGENHDQDNI